jgi:hypothetical protein
LTQNEQILAFGQSNGSILISNAIANMFGISAAVTVPHNASVNTVKFTSDSVFLISGAAAPNSKIHVYYKRNNFTTSLNISFPAQSIGYFQPFN